MKCWFNGLDAETKHGVIASLVIFAVGVLLGVVLLVAGGR